MSANDTPISFQEFYPLYLQAHSNVVSRRLHFAGSLIALICLAAAIYTRVYWWILLALIAAYGCAWVGHFVFEKNKPASFKQPLWSFVGDWVMVKDILVGRLSLIDKAHDKI